MSTAKARFEPSKLRANIPPLGPDYQAMWRDAVARNNELETQIGRVIDHCQSAIDKATKGPVMHSGETFPAFVSADKIIKMLGSDQ